MTHTANGPRHKSVVGAALNEASLGMAESKMGVETYAGSLRIGVAARSKADTLTHAQHSERHGDEAQTQTKESQESKPTAGKGFELSGIPGDDERSVYP